jgi:hypothetical protein
MTLLYRPKRSNLLDELLTDEPITEPLPSTWNGPHVGLRITQGFTTLLRLPGGVRLGAQTAWPAYLYEFDDLVAQQEQGELERTQEQQNRTRILPSADEIARAIDVTYWPAKYLHGRHPELCEAVNAVALAHALGLDAGWVTRKRGSVADTWRRRRDLGCERIAVGLVKDRVSVF